MEVLHRSHGLTCTTLDISSTCHHNILRVSIFYLAPFVSMCHMANIDLHSSRKDHPVARQKEGMSEVRLNPEQKFTITTSKPSLSINLGVPKYSSRIMESMLFARRESW